MPLSVDCRWPWIPSAIYFWKELKYQHHLLACFYRESKMCSAASLPLPGPRLLLKPCEPFWGQALGAGPLVRHLVKHLPRDLTELPVWVCVTGLRQVQAVGNIFVRCSSKPRLANKLLGYWCSHIRTWWLSWGETNLASDFNSTWWLKSLPGNLKQRLNRLYNTVHGMMAKLLQPV